MTRVRLAAVVGLLPLLAMVPGSGLAQDAVPPASQPAVPAYTTGQLDQMLAPIALYPDSLLTQILIASTYPIQVVEAERWLQNPANAAIHGDALVDALQPLPWDPSVKSLIPFPQIVKQLNDNLDWTQSLGSAFANQQADAMARVQALRQQAEAAGTLTSTPQQRVVHEGAAVVIEPANPAVVYVPVYNPVAVYGRWAYAAYPPFYFPPAPGFFVGPVGIGIGFSVGFGVVGPLWGWGHPVWGERNIVINNAYYSRISFNHAGFEGGVWHHPGPVGFVGGAGFRGPGAAGFHGAAAAGFHESARAHGGGGRAAARSFGGGAHAASAARGAGNSGHRGAHGGSGGHEGSRGNGHNAAAHGGGGGHAGGHGGGGHAHGGGHDSGKRHEH